MRRLLLLLLEGCAARHQPVFRFLHTLPRPPPSSGLGAALGLRGGGGAAGGGGTAATPEWAEGKLAQRATLTLRESLPLLRSARMTGVRQFIETWAAAR
jgi:hypothetical protein